MYRNIDISLSHSMPIFLFSIFCDAIIIKYLYRYAFTVIANVMVYTTAWLLLDTHTDTDNKPKNQLSPADSDDFRVSYKHLLSRSFRLLKTDFVFPIKGCLVFRHFSRKKKHRSSQNGGQLISSNYSLCFLREFYQVE